MTELEMIEDHINASLTTIRQHWDTLLTPSTARRPGGGRGGQSTRGIPRHDPINDPLGVLVADDHLDTEADIDRTTRVVSLRRYVWDVLRAWCLLVAEDRPVKKALPTGGPTSAVGVPQLCEFLHRHAQWMSGHEDAAELVETLQDLADRVTRMAVPRRRDWVHLGDCPFVTDLLEVPDRFWTGKACTGQVRSRIGGDGTARCTGCGTEQEVAWWEDVLGIGWAPVTLPKLLPILRDRLHITVTERTLRNWRRDGLITTYPEPFGPALQWDRYDPQVVLDQVARLGRQCASCGTVWHGYSDICTRCYVSLPDRPTRAKAHRSTPAPMSLSGWCPWPRNVVPNPHDTDRPERCHYSDLPLNQCACGRHTERTSA